MLWRLKRFQKRTLHGWQISLDSKFSSVKNLLLIVSFPLSRRWWGWGAGGGAGKEGGSVFLHLSRRWWGGGKGRGNDYCSVWINDYFYVKSNFRHHNVDVSVAVSTEFGLITPIVFNADKKVSTKLFNADICLTFVTHCFIHRVKTHHSVLCSRCMMWSRNAHCSEE